MPTPKAHLLPQNSEDQRLLLRLGVAVTLHWDAVAPDLQRRLVNQAAAVLDPTDLRVGLYESLLAVIDRVRCESGSADEDGSA